MKFPIQYDLEPKARSYDAYQLILKVQELQNAVAELQEKLADKIKPQGGSAYKPGKLADVGKKEGQ